MSILGQPSVPEVDPAVRVANMIKNQTRQAFRQMLMAFNRGSNNFWKNPVVTPQQIATALGTDAKEVFEIHFKIRDLLASVKPEAIEQGDSVVGQFTLNEDGTVTIL